MILMHCAVDLPRDYSLAKVRERIARDAPALDEAPGVLLWAHAVRDADAAGISTHRYVHTAVWANTSRMADYLWGEDQLEKVRAQYGHVDVSLWSIAGLQIDREHVHKADALEIEFTAPEGESRLSQVGATAKKRASKDIGSRDMAAAIYGVDATDGRAVRVHVRRGLSRQDGGLSYDMAHLWVAPSPRRD